MWLTTSLKLWSERFVGEFFINFGTNLRSHGLKLMRAFFVMDNRDMIIEKPLEIQKFLRTDGNTLGDLKQDPYKLSINVGPDRRRVCFKYNQIKSDMGLRIPKEARGLILDRQNDWEVVSYALPKFFNAAENEAATIDWESAEVFEKMDGSCVSGDAKIITEDGEKTIREICENHYDGRVRSYDTERGEVVWDKVVGWFVRPSNDDWYELETEDGQIVKLTGDHRVYLPDLDCYRRVDELNGNEKVVVMTED